MRAYKNDFKIGFCTKFSFIYKEKGTMKNRHHSGSSSGPFDPGKNALPLRHEDLVRKAKKYKILINCFLK